MIPSTDDLSRRGFSIGENRRGHLKSRHKTLPFQTAVLGRSSPQDNQICCRDRLLEESGLPLLNDEIDLERCKEESMLRILVACTSKTLVADLREDSCLELRLLSPAAQELGGESTGLVSMSSVVHCSVADLSHTTLDSCQKGYPVACLFLEGQGYALQPGLQCQGG